MKYSLVLLFFCFLSAGCVRHQQQNSASSEIAEIHDTVVVKYAEGFDVNYYDGYLALISHSIRQNSFFADTLFLQTDPLKADSSMSYLSRNLNSIACQSSTHIAFLDLLNELDVVTGLCGMEYIQNVAVHEKLQKNGTLEICPGEQVSIEALQKLNPDLFLIYPFETTGKEKYNASGITSFYIAEYLETTALARLEWIKLFGVLMNKVNEANAYFEQVETEYLQLKRAPVDSARTFILNLPFKDNWHMPSANSLVVNLFEDAGLRYYYPETGLTENDLHSKEAVWNDALFADYWIIMASRPAGFSMADLVAEEPAYAGFKAVIQNQVIFCNTATSNYFSSGIAEPQVMLKDILFATGQLEDHEPEYFFLLN